MAGNPPTSYTTDPTLFLYTSLTAGSSHIITATSRLETILKANKIPFRAIDVATDEKARMIWGRRSKGRKLPGLVRYASIVGDLDQIEEWNEYGELKAQIAATLSPYDASKSEPQKVAVAPTATGAAAQPKTTSSAPHIRIGDTPSRTPSGEQHVWSHITMQRMLLTATNAPNSLATTHEQYQLLYSVPQTTAQRPSRN
ncbi:hypothetical protein TEQG_07106 [Trichophyton equinum CBS 127.97]|uniref:Glutaredoxin domain-containing protein n=1 Tax=Trichophyton equinum (strain ATCC MYA-4606 / CBS 127.97) TaxID=559882 RepID=F2Q1M2_TRIEC|nr:hypothetical protein TEQG_07106 [Trichophyton equinum CBS 127.97]